MKRNTLSSRPIYTNNLKKVCDKIPIRNLPLLKYAQTLFCHLDLSKTLIIATQHLYSTTYELFKALFEIGLKADNLFVMGKCYSTDPKVFFQLSKDGVHVSPDSMNFDSYLSYDVDFDRKIDLFVNDILYKKDVSAFEKVILLDDGGHLIERVLKSFPKESSIVGVEQTSSGYNKLKNSYIPFPIVNMARSWLKLDYESPIIIKLSQRKLLEKLIRLNHTPSKVLIIGHGAIGQHLYKVLQDTFEVKVFDREPSKSICNFDHFDQNLKNFDLLIGCTGTTVVPVTKYALLHNPVTLASLSSSDREFDAVYLRRTQPRTFNCHSDIISNGITLLNCGFPCTFDEDYDVSDTDDFQLTRSLLFVSICQAFCLNMKTFGFIDLDNEIQEKLRDFSEKL